MNTDKLIATFNENIAYIESSHPQLFSKLVALDNAVANGHYQEKYEIVFDNGYFDVLEKDSKKYLYEKNSDEYANLVAKSVDYGVNDNLFIASPEHEMSDAKIEYFKKLPLLQDSMSGFSPILHFMQKKMPKKIELKKIEKFIFFGLGLGLHLYSVNEKIQASQYLIVEDDLELFRLSLFTCNYKNLAKNAKLYFSVFDDNAEFTSLSDIFLKEKYENNRYIKYFEMLSHSEKKRDLFHLAVTNQAHLRFSYASILKQSLLPLENLFGSYQFLQKSVTLQNSTFEKKSFLLLGAGPSLAKNIKVLKQKSKSFIVVAVSATLSLLEKENIVPDIVIHLDAFDAALKHFESLKNISFIENSLCLFSAKTSPLISLRLKKENIFFFESSTAYKTNSFRPSSPCVGSISYQILLYLKVKNIYTLGLDLAVDSKTGKTHSDSHAYVKQLDLKKKIDGANIEYKKDLIKVDGNKDVKVLTTPHFKTSIDAINYFSDIIKEDSQKVVNFSDGAKFVGINSMNIEDFTGSKFNDAKKELKEIFAKFVVNTLEEKEIQSIKDKITDAKDIREAFYKYQNKSYNDAKSYKIALLNLVYEVSKNSDNDLSRALETYFRYLLPYIFDFLNTKGLRVSKKDFEFMNDLFLKHLLNIC